MFFLSLYFRPLRNPCPDQALSAQYDMTTSIHAA